MLEVHDYVWLQYSYIDMIMCWFTDDTWTSKVWFLFIIVIWSR